MFQKTLVSGDMGSVVLTEQSGLIEVAIKSEVSLGGGSVAGVAKVSLQASASVSSQELIDAGFALAEAKFPSVASLLKEAQDLIDAELAKA